MTVQTFQVDVDPRGWARPRNNRASGAWYVDAETKAHKDAIAWAYRAAVPGRPNPTTDPVEVTIVAGFRPPVSWPMWRLDELERDPDGPFSSHTVKPDADNVAKGVLDALNALAWGDDAQVAAVHVHKRWALTPGYVVTIRHLPVPAATLTEHRRATA